MKLTAFVYNNEDLLNILEYADAVILMDKRLGLISGNLDIDNAIKLCEEKNVEAILGFNKIMHNQDLIVLKENYNKYKSYKCLFYVSDIGAANLAKKEGLINRTIYNPETMITNYLDLYEYKELGFRAMGMSLEIPTKDIIYSYEKTNAPMIYQVFGHHLMFYSKRKLLTLYKEKASISIEGSKRYLKEEKRNDYYPVFENENGTMLYRPYSISLLKELKNLSFLEYITFDSIDIDSKSFISVLEIYKNYLNSDITLEEALNKMAELSLLIEDGFTYSDSVYIKEEF